MKLIRVLLLASLLLVGTRSFAQLPDRDPPGDANVDRPTMKRAQMLGKMGKDKRKNPEPNSNNAPTTNYQPVLKPLRLPHRVGEMRKLPPKAVSFATASRRNREMRKHFERLAKLERIKEVAKQTSDDALSAQADEIISKEMTRHARALENIERLRKEALGEPTDIGVKVDAAQ